MAKLNRQEARRMRHTLYAAQLTKPSDPANACKPT
jgi:hypothetical protein